MTNKIIALPIILSSIAGLSVAADSTTPDAAQSIEITNVNKDMVGKENSFEKAVTPLLREISIKRSKLELRKLDRDLEKINEEEIKANIALDALMNASTKGDGNQSTQAPATPPPVNTNPNIGLSNPSEIKVLMIFGFDNNLFAKLASGQQGGYVVKKGDVMPDGRIVSKITSNFVEVKKDSGVNSDSSTQRFFVSSYNDVAAQQPANSASQGSIPQPMPQQGGGGGMPSEGGQAGTLFPSLPASL